MGVEHDVIVSWSWGSDEPSGRRWWAGLFSVESPVDPELGDARITFDNGKAGGIIIRRFNPGTRMGDFDGIGPAPK